MNLETQNNVDRSIRSFKQYQSLFSRPQVRKLNNSVYAMYMLLTKCRVKVEIRVYHFLGAALGFK